MMNFLCIWADCCWDSFCAYVGPFRGYVGAKKFVLEIQNFWCEKVGVGVAHVWPMLGHVEAMLGLCWACLGPFGG